MFVLHSRGVEHVELILELEVTLLLRLLLQLEEFVQKGLFVCPKILNRFLVVKFLLRQLFLVVDLKLFLQKLEFIFLLIALALSVFNCHLHLLDLVSKGHILLFNLPHLLAYFLVFSLQLHELIGVLL
jgi:hypothetical protein